MKMRLEQICRTAKNLTADALGMTVAGNIGFAVWENVVLGYSDQLSLQARLNSTFLFYPIAGTVFSKGRGLFYKSGLRQSGRNDLIYSGIFGLVYGTALYTLSRGTPEEIAYGTVTGIPLATALGIPTIKMQKFFRNLFETAAETPEYIRIISKPTQAALGASALAAAIAIVGCVYHATPPDFKGIKGYAIEMFSPDSLSASEEQEINQDIQAKSSYCSQKKP